MDVVINPWTDELDITTVEQGTSSSVVSITPSSGTISTNCSLGRVFKVTITENSTIANPTNGVNGRIYTWWIKEDDVFGGWTISLGTKFVIPSSATNPLNWVTTVGKMNIFAAQYDSAADKYYVVSMIGGY